MYYYTVIFVSIICTFYTLCTYFCLKFYIMAKTGGDSTNEKPITRTIRAYPSKLDKMEGVAYWERKTILEVFDEAMSDYIAKYEKKNGTLKAIPKK